MVEEEAGELLFLLDKFRTTVNIKLGKIAGVDVGDVENLVEVLLGKFFLVDASDTVGAINDNLLLVVG